MAAIVDHAKENTEAREKIELMTTRLFKGIWDNRDIVRMTDPGIRHLGGETDDTTMLSTLVGVYYGMYRE